MGTRKDVNILKLVMIVSIIIIGIVVIYYKFFHDSDKNVYILLFGEEIMSIYVNDQFNDPGCIAFDENGENYTGKINVINNINTNIVGSYTITYQALSKRGKIIGETNRIVYVIENPLDKVTFQLIGSDVVSSLFNMPYVDLGYSAIDDMGNDITNRVVTSGYVDINKVGSYMLTYTLSLGDASKTLTREVKVMDIEINSSLSESNITNKDITIHISVNDNDLMYIELPNSAKINVFSTDYIVSKNDNYVFNACNKYGMCKEHIVSVNNIDKEPPSGTCSIAGGVIRVNAIDNSLINGYSYSVNYGTYTGYISNSTYDTKVIYANNASVKIIDVASNESTLNCSRTIAIGPNYNPYSYKDSLGYDCIYPYTCFKQLDYGDRYRAVLDNVSTISTSGCLPSSLAIVLSGFDVRGADNNIYTPSTLVNKVIYKDGKITGHSNYKRTVEVMTGLGLSVSQDYSFRDNLDILRSHLRLGYPAVIGVQGGCYTGGAHFMAILAINGNDEVFLSDPYSRTTISYRKSYKGYTCVDNTWIKLSDLLKFGGLNYFVLISP